MIELATVAVPLKQRQTNRYNLRQSVPWPGAIASSHRVQMHRLEQVMLQGFVYIKAAPPSNAIASRTTKITIAM